MYMKSPPRKIFKFTHDSRLGWEKNVKTIAKYIKMLIILIEKNSQQFSIILICLL